MKLFLKQNVFCFLEYHYTNIYSCILAGLLTNAIVIFPVKTDSCRLSDKSKAVSFFIIDFTIFTIRLNLLTS